MDDVVEFGPAHLWFAWHPVKTQDASWVFWSEVWSVPYHVDGVGNIPSGHLHYKFAINAAYHSNGEDF